MLGRIIWFDRALQVLQVCTPWLLFLVHWVAHPLVPVGGGGLYPGSLQLVSPLFVARVETYEVRRAKYAHTVLLLLVL